MTAPTLLVVGKLRPERKRSLTGMAVAAKLSLVAIEEPAEALKWLDTSRPHCLLVDASVKGLEKLIAKVRSKPGGGIVPVLALVQAPDDLFIEQYFGWGGDEIVPAEAGASLLERLRTVAREPPQVCPGRRVIIADPDKARCDVLGRAFSQAGYEVRSAIERTSLEFLVKQYDPPAVVVNGALGDLPELIARVRKENRNAGWLVLAARRDLDAQQAALSHLERCAVLGLQSSPWQLLYLANAVGRAPAKDSAKDSVMERRSATRHYVGSQVLFRASGGDDDELGVCYNVSLGGMYVRTMAPPTAGEVWLEWRVPQEKTRIRLEGRVVYRQDNLALPSRLSAPLGFGVEFSDYLGSARVHLENALASLQEQANKRSQGSLPVTAVVSAVSSGKMAAAPRAHTPEPAARPISLPPRPAGSAVAAPPRPERPLAEFEVRDSGLMSLDAEDEPTIITKASGPDLLEPLADRQASPSESPQEKLHLPATTSFVESPSPSDLLPTERYNAAVFEPDLEGKPAAAPAPAPEPLPAPAPARRSRASLTIGAVLVLLGGFAAVGYQLRSTTASDRAGAASAASATTRVPQSARAIGAVDTAPSPSTGTLGTTAAASAASEVPSPSGGGSEVVYPDPGGDIPGYPPVEEPQAGKGRLLADRYGYLVVRFPEPAFIFFENIAIGPVNSKIATLCGEKTLRIGVGEKPATFLSDAATVNVPCRETTRVVFRRLAGVEAPPGAMRPIPNGTSLRRTRGGAEEAENPAVGARGSEGEAPSTPLPEAAPESAPKPTTHDLGAVETRQ